MKIIKKTMALLCLYVAVVSSSNANLITQFDLECTACGIFGDFSITFFSTQDANLAPSFTEYSPGQFFYIGLPDINGSLFAHSAGYGGGYNFTSGTFNVSMAPGSLIFDGPTSAPVWRDGVYTDVANYFQPGANLGTVRLTINTESVPVPSLFSLFGLSIIVLMIRKFKK